ncbi:hypothetical protein AB7828_10150 [Tardiphaga sp. 215_C5_N2_1]|uniref:hypothetical protein n=1 Tax=Tardiphaga sp. 215_C5_N2_1 TaxID=3240774 RepID=UPI003F89670D
MLDSLTRYFVAISALTVGLSSAVAMIMLSAYLSIFDWTLIWIIEYSDLAKLALVGTALASGIYITAFQYIQSIYDAYTDKTKFRYFIFGFMILIWGLTTGRELYLDYASNGPLYSYHLAKTLSWGLFLFIAFVGPSHLADWTQRKWSVIGSDISMLTVFLGLTAATFAFYTRDVSENSHEIKTKSATFDRTKIIMMLSHHVVFMVEKRVVVIPASDVVKIETVAVR